MLENTIYRIDRELRGTHTIVCLDGSGNGNGNTISRATGTSQVRYYWDDEDKMVRVEDSVVMNFKVDGLGFRRFKEVVGQYQRWFVYDLAASETPGLAPLVAEYDGNGNLVAKYHSDGVGLMAMTSGNQSYWYGFEALGTTRQLMGSQGQVVDAYAYDAWGNELTRPQSPLPNPFRYVGKHGYYLDTESALMLLGVRYYDAKVARFWSLDPLKEDGWNWYLHVQDNPVNSIDPSGLFKLIGCTPEKHPLTLKALELACRKGATCPYLNDFQKKCVEQLCKDNTTPFRCGSPYCATGKVCGYACPWGTRYEGIVICVSLVATEYCKPRGCEPSKVEQIARVILHEILHMCGVPDHPDYLREQRHCSVVNGQVICAPDRGNRNRTEGINPADGLALKCLELYDKGCQPLPAYKYSDPSGWNPCQDWRPPKPKPKKCFLLFPPPWEWEEVFQ